MIEAEISKMRSKLDLYERILLETDEAQSTLVELDGMLVRADIPPDQMNMLRSHVRYAERLAQGFVSRRALEQCEERLQLFEPLIRRMHAYCAEIEKHITWDAERAALCHWVCEEAERGRGEVLMALGFPWAFLGGRLLGQLGSLTEISRPEPVRGIVDGGMGCILRVLIMLHTAFGGDEMKESAGELWNRLIDAEEIIHKYARRAFRDFRKVRDDEALRRVMQAICDAQMRVIEHTPPDAIPGIVADEMTHTLRVFVPTQLQRLCLEQRVFVRRDCVSGLLFAIESLHMFHARAIRKLLMAEGINE